MRWQHVHTALPGTGTQVLVYTDNGNVELATYTGLGQLGSPLWLAAQDTAVFLDIDTVTHWHPLPEPPQ